MSRLQNCAFVLGLISVLLAAHPASQALAETWPDRIKLTSLLRNGQFALLDDRLSSYQEAFEAGELGDELVEHAFLAFSNSDPGLRLRLDDWNDAFPDSYAAPLARAVYNINLAWLARGVRYGRKTPNERFRSMRDIFQTAQADLQLAIWRNSKLSTAYGLAIQIAMASGEKDTKRPILDAAIEAVPNTYVARSQYLYSLLPWWDGPPEKMQAFLGELRGWESRVPRLKNLRGFLDFAKADQLKRKGKYKQSLVLYDSALKQGEHSIIFRHKGNALRKLRRYEEALPLLTRALDLHPQLKSILDNRANTFRRLKQPEKAMADWDLALQLDPYNTHILRNRSYAFSDRKMYQQAINDLTKALVLGDYDAAVHDRLGFLYAKRLHDRVRGLAEAERAVSLVPHETRYLYTKISILYDEWDCRIVEPVRAYVRLCEKEADCPAGKLKWVQGLADVLQGHHPCPTE